MAPPQSGPNLSCFLAIGHSATDDTVVKALGQSIREAGFRQVPEIGQNSSGTRERSLTEQVALADCVVADISRGEPNVFLELGLARALGKTIFLTCAEESRKNFEVFGETNTQVFFYQASVAGLATLRRTLVNALRLFRKYPRTNRNPLGNRVRSLFAVDWENIGGADFDNLCLELLSQLGYKRIEWQGKSVEVDLTAELPRKDPDGFEYKEQWLISLGRNAPIEHVVQMVNHDPDFFLHRVTRHNERLRSRVVQETAAPVTFLIISVESSRQRELFGDEFKVSQRNPALPGIRLRFWNRTYLTNLVYQFPPIGFKYFSDEGRAKSKYRKTPEELYEENLDLSKRLVLERDMRVRAERDAVWKEISFSAAHKMGNPIFAIETNLDPLQKRIDEGRLQEATQVVSDLRHSVEKAKTIVAQFRSLAVSRPSDRKSIPLKPILEAACNMLRSSSVFCSVECPDELTVYGDAHQLGECFDELASNALHWFDKDPKTVSISARILQEDSVPAFLESGVDYVVVQFTDNGRGIPVDDKLKIFNAFYTTYAHGTGLGLALTRRIIEAHGGKIMEVGKPGVGAVFEVYLPITANLSSLRVRETNQMQEDLADA